MAELDMFSNTRRVAVWY